MNINIIGVCNNLSYGIVTKNIVKALSELGHHVHLSPLYPPEYNETEREFIKPALDKPYDEYAPQILIWHQGDLDKFREGSGKKIGFPIFELDTLTATERMSMNSCDELFVCSKWAKQICNNNNIFKPVHVVPLGVDSTIFTNRNNRPNDIFNITCIGKIELRKGMECIPQIIKLAFPNGGNYKLRMSWNNPFFTKKEVKEWEDYYVKELGDNVEFVPPLSQDGMVDLISSSHVILSASKAEGFNLSLMEALACGTHVIALNYSAHTEYLTNDNAYLVEPTGFEPAIDGTNWFVGQGSWATYDYQDFANKLTNLYDVHWYGLGLYDPNLKGIDTAKEFSWTNTVRTIIENLRSI